MKLKLNKVHSIVILLCLLMSANSLHAQFLKKIINDVKQTAQNRADDKANDATNKTIDKIGSSTKKKSSDNSSNIDTAAFGGVLGAFAKAAQDNPNDTSGADLAMKALGNLTGGGGVSAADSADAIKNYMTANGGSGIYYEYAIETNTKQNGAAKSTSKMYLTSNGEGRSEMNLAAIMGAKNGSPLVVIGRMNQPHYSVILDDENKAYSLNVIDTSLINMVHEKYQVTKLGNETVNGYNCIHAKLISTTGSGMFKSSSTEDIWTSVDVPGYALLKKATLQQNVTPGMMKALDDAGCGGFFVKMTAGDGKDYSMTMQLTKADKQSFSSSMFKIPAGYTESKGNLMFGNMMQAAQKQ
ncbi:MAG: DUF4412 domain-containing protein [Parafilimonas sp.]